MPKSRRGQLHHAPDPDTQAGRQYAALQAERQGIRDERRANHETLQGIKEAERRVAAALVELDERIAAAGRAQLVWTALERDTRERMREVMRGVIEGEIAPFRKQIQKDTKSVADILEKTRVAIIQAETEILGFEKPSECLDYIADKIMAAIRADLEERLREPAAGLILEIVRKSSDGQARG